MFYTVYKITNNINKKYYIGKHQTKDLNDGYMGSGKLLKRAIKKYGLVNFSKEILHVFQTEQEMNDKEKELVILQEMCYNLCEGGKGGFGYINNNSLGVSNNQKQSARVSINTARKYVKRESLLNNLKLAQTKRQEIFPNGVWNGKQHSEETKRKMSQTKNGTNIGSKNSQFGTFWITNGTINQKCRGEIPLGFYRGRVSN